MLRALALYSKVPVGLSLRTAWGASHTSQHAWRPYCSQLEPKDHQDVRDPIFTQPIQAIQVELTTHSRSGYAETVVADAEAQKYASLLRVPLKEVKQKSQEEKAKEAAGAADLYAQQLAANPYNTLDHFLETRVNKDAAYTLNKLIGVMTKKGYKSKARKILLDAMHIIRKRLKDGTVNQMEEKLSKPRSYFHRAKTVKKK